MHSIFAWYFLSLTGRIKRQEFSLGYFGLLAVCGLLTRLLTEIAFSNTAARTWYRDELAVALSLPFLFAVLILIWPFIAIMVKRLHDLNLSGWWMLLALAIPFSARLIGVNPSTLLLMAYAMLSSLPGSSGNNRFGIDPVALRRSNARG
jgi:uncharacterized membrane protein YhaH (DUF805 family)